MELSKRESVISAWITWHFFEMPRFLLMVWKNYLVFGANYFSLPLLLATLLSPWRRYRWNYPRGFQIGEFAGIFVSNVFSRVIGAICRLVLMVFGALFQLFIFVAGILALLFWLLIPFIVMALIAYIIYVRI